MKNQRSLHYVLRQSDRRTIIEYFQGVYRGQHGFVQAMQKHPVKLCTHKENQSLQVLAAALNLQESWDVSTADLLELLRDSFKDSFTYSLTKSVIDLQDEASFMQCIERADKSIAILPKIIPANADDKPKPEFVAAQGLSKTDPEQKFHIEREYLLDLVTQILNSDKHHVECRFSIPTIEIKIELQKDSEARI